jgi:hypothetical protein
MKLPVNHVDVRVEDKRILVQLAPPLRNLWLSRSQHGRKDEKGKNCFRLETTLY